MDYRSLLDLIMFKFFTLLNTVKYLWLYCKNKNFLIKYKYFKDIYNE